ncbi:unnamed protein product [Urochloa humidicola]
MKSGINVVDSNGSSGPIRSCKAQKCLDDYIAGVRAVHIKKMRMKSMRTWKGKRKWKGKSSCGGGKSQSKSSS